MKKQITLKELSKILGVSISTISKALNDSYEISASTKARIKEAAKLYNYQPNVAAINLKSGKTKTIGVIIPSVQNFFMARVLYGIEDAIAKTDYNAIVCTTKEMLEREKNSVKSLSNGLVDGFIIAVSEETQVKKEYDHFQLALDKSKPIVMFDRVVKDLDCDKIVIDDFDAVKRVAEEMKSNGLSKIILAATIQNLTVGVSRIEGYKSVVNESVVIESSEEDIEKELTKFFQTNKADAIIAIDEAATLASIRACKKLNIDIPKTTSIVGYTSDVMAENVTPTITTIKQHSYTVGTKAAEMLLQKLADKSKETQRELVNSSLVKRTSTCF